MDGKKVYTVQESCALLRCGRTKFYDLLGTGKLNAIRFGKKTLVRGDEIERFLADLPAAVTPKSAQSHFVE